jgi:hypothetical protein
MDGQQPRRTTTLAIEPVWKAIGPELGRELIELWARTRAIGNAFTAVSRSNQAVCVGRDADGTILAVGTAVVRVLPRLQEPLYYYRQYFDPRLRGQGHALPFFNRAREVLAAHNAALAAPESLGVLLEVENPWLAAHYAQAHIAQADSTFIGYSPRGLQLRVSYFGGARLAAKPLVRQRRRVG